MPAPETARVCPHCSHTLEPGADKVCASCGKKLPRKPSRAGVRVRLAVGILGLLIAAGIFYDNMTNPHSIFRKIGQTSPPVYQWVQSDDRTFDVLPGEGKAWGPVDPQQGEIHYDISAALPVDTGLMENGTWGERMDAWDSMKAASVCYESKILKSSKVCRMQTGKPYLIFIRDVRMKQFGLGGLGPTLATKSLQDQNSVTITIFARKCTENCKSALP